MSEKKNTRSVRVWTTLDVDEVTRPLLYIDDLYGSCANCKQLGLNYTKDRSCPGCKTEFKYLATKVTDPGIVAQILNRIQTEKMPLQLIERADFEKAEARDALGGLFK